MTRIGTSYFVSKIAACAYYKAQGHAATYYEALGLVVAKLQDGEIHIGEPHVEAGQRLVLLDNNTRYGIEG